MQKTPIQFLITAVVLIATASSSFAWRSTLYPVTWTSPGIGFGFETAKIIQDFSYAGYGDGAASLPTGGQIFNVRTTVIAGSGFADNTGNSDSTAAIQAYINACKNNGGGVVLLPAGTYKVSCGTGSSALRVSSDNVIIRGEGKGVTKIVNTTTNMRGKSVILFAPAGNPTQETAVNLRADHLRPYTRILVANASGFQVGDLVELAWDFTPEWIAENNQQSFWTSTDKPNPALYVRRITAVDVAGKAVTINAPTRYYMKMRDNARIYKIGNRLRECGIERLSIGNLDTTASGFGESDYTVASTAGYQVHEASLIKMAYTINCFMHQIESFDPEGTGDSHMLSCGVVLHRAANTSVQFVTMQKPQYGGGGGNGYMFKVLGCENLFNQCSALYSRHGFSLTSSSTSGNVFYKCSDSFSGLAAGTPASGRYVTGGYGSDTHGDFTHSNLWDSCSVTESQWEAFHRGTESGNAGATSAHGVFWNTEGGKQSLTHVNASGHCIITNQAEYGYVIGTKGLTSGVKSTISSGTNMAPADHVEGVGSGATLEPQSLWIDQKERRLN